MKRIFIFLLSLAFILPVFGQPVPKSYERQIKRQTKKVERQEKKHDVVLDPSESVPLFLTQTNDQKALENWGVDYLQFSAYREKIISRPGKRKILIVSFDTAGDLDHPSLLAAALKGYTYTGEKPKDEHGHGTHVAGIMASDFTNIGLLQSLIKDGYVKILPVKILHNQGWGDKDEIVEGVRDILEIIQPYIQAGWQIIFNNSWGGSLEIKELRPLYDEALNLGVIIVAASGNNGTAVIGCPACMPQVISAGALRQDATGDVSRASYSQYGKDLDLVAPGDRIYSTYKTGSFAFLSGTSMACPEVVAAIAITSSYHPNSTAPEVVNHVKKYATDLAPQGKDIFTGHGAPRIGVLLDNIPEKIDTDPQDPPADSIIIKPERVITLPAYDLPMVWGIGSTKDQRPIKINLVLNVTTSHLAEYSSDEVYKIINSFFGKVGLMFSNPKADVYDAGEWTARFFHRHANKSQRIYKIGIQEITVKDEAGRIFIIQGTDLKVNQKYDVKEIPELYLNEKA